MSLKGKSSSPAQAPLLKNAALASVVYFDSVPVYGAMAGNIEIELASRMLMPKADGGVGIDMTCTAHLRCPILAAVALRDALDKALSMAMPKHRASDVADGEDDFEPSPLLNS